MDYKRIYDLFIENRQSKREELLESGCYYERHHIIPKALGGNNKKSNLIELTPEDHFFAHLLLAKIHGGKMMRALFAMSNLRNGCEYRPDFSKRMRYGHIRRLVAREYSEKYSGENSPVSDKNIYTLNNHDGRSVSGNRVYIKNKTGLSRGNISQLLLGDKLNYKGWYNPLINVDGLNRKQLFRNKSKIVSKKIHNLFHFDGGTWSGTRLDFLDEFGRKLHFQNDGGHCGGWYRTREESLSHFEIVKKKSLHASKSRGDISGINNPRADHTIYEWINFKTLERKSATRVQIMEMLGVKSGEIHSLFSRRQKTVRGWGLYEVFLKKDDIKIYRKDRHGKEKSRAGL